MAKMFHKKYFPPSMVTKLKNEITNFRQRPDESLFEAWERYKLSIDRCPNNNMLPVTQIDTFYNGLTLRHHDTINVAAGGTFIKRRPEECYDLIENMTAHHNDWDTSIQRSESSSSITSSDSEIVALKAEMAEINKNIMKVLQINQQVKEVTHSCETYGGPHSYNDFPATIGQIQNVYAAGAYNQGGNSYQPQGNRNLLSYHSDNYLRPPGFNQNQNRSNLNQNYQNQNRNQGNNHPQGNNQGRNQFFQGASHGQNPPPAYQALGYQALINMTSLTNSNLELKNMFGQFMKMNTASSSGLRTLLSNTITNPKEDLKGITTRSGNVYKGPTIPTTYSLPKVVERETEVTKDTVPPTNNGSTKDVQPLFVQVENQIPNSEPIVEPIVAPVSAPKPNPKPSIPYPSRLHDQKLHDKANDQKEIFFQIFKDFDFNISFADALILMPKPFDLSSGRDRRRCLRKSRNVPYPSRLRSRELNHRVGKEAVTFNLDQSSRYSANYDAMSVNRIDLFDVACEVYFQEVLRFSEIVALKAKMAEINKNIMKVLQINHQVKAVTPSCESCGSPHSYNDCPATVGQTQNIYAARAYQGGNSYQPQGNRNLLSYRSDNYLGPPGFNQNQNQNNQNQNFQNQNRNQGNNHPGYQAPVHRLPIPQPQVVTTTEFTNYMKANDAILKNMQTNITSLTNSNLELKNMFGQFMKMNTASSSGLRTLPSNTVTNPKEDLKDITTRSGTTYRGPTIPITSSSLPKVVERETNVIKDTVPPTNNERTKDVQPSVVQI
nr:hypothetical protein [Tanacetum cinerariifolium]